MLKASSSRRTAAACKYFFLFALVIPAAMGQTGTAGIAGTVLDAKTRKPIPAALVMAIQSGLPPLSRNTRSGPDGAFQIQGLPAGKYSLCVQAQGDGYLDPCQWDGSPATVTLVSGQAAAGVALALAAASVVYVQVRDAHRVLSQKTRDGRRPELTLGVWGPKGLYYPARASGSLGAEGGPLGGMAYQIAVPRDTALKLHIASRDLQLGDAAGAALPGNATQQAFQHAAGDARPQSFAYTVLGLLP
ncbi:MAG: carboxypeptidase regulatory-like domain-containing protein [Acidobacteria bacterium]|nr:carboxypeptidase regulatory-like domain-containing protein [Acidobacteriota bacterium]